MAMACAAAAVSSSSTTFLVSTKSISVSGGSSTSRIPVFRVRCGAQEEVSGEERAVSRRDVLSLAALTVFLSSSGKAQALDIPLFGVRKQLEKAEKAVEKAEKAVVKEVKQLAKGGGKGLESVSASVQEVVGDIESATSFSPTLQAGGVVGAELVAVLLASTVVNGVVSVPSKDSRGKR